MPDANTAPNASTAIGAGDSVIGRVKITDGTDVALVETDGSLDVKVTAGLVTGTIESSQVASLGTALTPKFAAISASSSGANTIVAAVAAKKLRVLSYVISASAAVNAKWQSHAIPTDKTGLLYMATNGGAVAGFNPAGWFETIAGEALDLNLSGATAVGGHLSYIEV